MSNLFVGLDIGTCNVRVVIGEHDENGRFEIIGVGEAPSTGLSRGVIVNIEATIKAVRSAIEKAENMAGVEVTSCYAGIGGNQIESLDSKGLASITNHGKGNREITQQDVDRAIESARSISLPLDRQILHVVPQIYIVDQVQRTKNPIDMIGVRLEVKVHIVTAMITTMQNIFKCATRAGYQIDGVMLKTLACAQSVLTEEEKDLGSILIDLGGGTTDVIVIADGAPVCTDSIPIGGNIVTSDISQVLGIGMENAERKKISDGCCWSNLLVEDTEILLPGVGGRPPFSVSRRQFCQIIQPRVEEILQFVREKVYSKIQGRKLSGNIVLVGGGARMSGIIELTSSVFGMEAVRIGLPANHGGIVEEYRNPAFATATGLALASVEQGKNSSDADEKGGSDKKHGVKDVLKNFFKDFF
ncbi:MAG: cell division protein FtsA [Treponemataceae bacterium]|nr:cell division protein FtsA [Spirochaetales bacterium]MDY6030318.1 cell division protein FtsA [Treponemataceae bacterium]